MFVPPTIDEESSLSVNFRKLEKGKGVVVWERHKIIGQGKKDIKPLKPKNKGVKLARNQPFKGHVPKCF